MQLNYVVCIWHVTSHMVLFNSQSRVESIELNAKTENYSVNKPERAERGHRDHICHKHHKQRLCKIIITWVKVHFVDVF